MACLPWASFIIFGNQILHRSNLVYIYKQANPQAHALKNPCSHAQTSMVKVPYASSVATPSTSLKENSRLNLASSEDRVPISLVQACSRAAVGVIVPSVWIFTKKIWVEWVRDLVASEKDLWHGKELAKENKGGYAGEGSKGRVERTHPRTMFARVWSCFTTFMVAALGVFVSSVTSTLYRSGKYTKMACLEVLTASRLRRGQTAHICLVHSWNSCLNI